MLSFQPLSVEKLFDIIYEDSELLVVNKPAGLVCHPTKTDEYSSLISRARLHLGPGSHPQLVNRLDRETSGVTLLAKDADTARELRQIWEKRQVEKDYLAIAHGHVIEAHGVIDAPLGKDEQSRVVIKDCVRADGAAARTEYWVRQRFTHDGLPFTLLLARPQTGRKHQIRIHLAHIGHPLVGEKIYGGDEDLYLALVEDRLTPEQRQRLILTHHALHACEVRYEWRGQPTVFHAEPEPWFTGFGGDSRRMAASSGEATV
ncbi:MAG: RluA family pseudouridine synthase [Verrucomicrobia bacterium]|nr:RluA family pseudouridine synthase [Verrucomicrobiota bacterium]